MGCDYYIEKYLTIYYNDKSTTYIPLSIDKGYFYYPDLDEDDVNYDKKYEEMIAEQLMSKMPPMVIYSNQQFLNEKLEQKYRSLIEGQFYNKYKINGNDNCKGWTNIVRIIKKESRYERD
jgi:hypothetical protein